MNHQTISCIASSHHVELVVAVKGRRKKNSNKIDIHNNKRTKDRYESSMVALRFIRADERCETYRKPARDVEEARTNEGPVPRCRTVLKAWINVNPWLALEDRRVETGVGYISSVDDDTTVIRSSFACRCGHLVGKERMARASFLLFGIFLIFNGAAGRAIPDFYTDEDLYAWHKFGLRSFYGPWSVIARKPNGDFVSYADYGARVPTDFRPISTSTIDDDSTAEIQSHRLTSKYDNGISDFSAEYGLTPYGVAMLANGAQAPHGRTDSSTNLSALVPNDLLDEKNFDIDANLGQSKTKITTAMNETESGEKKRDTLELIGIVGVITEEDDSVEKDSIALPSDASRELDDYGTTTTDWTIDLSSV